MLRKILISIAFVAVASLSLSAQTASTAYASDSTVVVSYVDDKYKVETNHFKDNWFITLQGGAQMMFADHSKQMKLMDRITPAATVSFGKWFTPTIAVRAKVTGWELKGVSGWSGHTFGSEKMNNYQGFIVNPQIQNGHIVGDIYGKEQSGTYDLYNTKVQYINTSLDVVFDVMNLFGGYKTDRVFHLMPYIGLGWATTLNAPAQISSGKVVDGKKSNEVSANAGLILGFRLSDALWLNLSADAAYINDRFDGQIGGRWGEGILQTQLGLTYNIPGRGWNQSKTTTITYNEQLLRSLQDRVNDLQRANKQLENRLASAGQVKDAKETIIAGPLLVTFVIDKWDLSNKDKVNLGFLAEAMKADPESTFVIGGYADRGTGSKERNQFLSEKRAEVVYNFLVEECGIDASRLRKEFNGGVENMYYDDPRCSRAVITRVAK